MKYLKKFIKNDKSTFDELAKEFVENYQHEVADFIYCLIDNSTDEKKSEILDMTNNIRNGRR